MSPARIRPSRSASKNPSLLGRLTMAIGWSARPTSVAAIAAGGADVVIADVVAVVVAPAVVVVAGRRVVVAVGAVVEVLVAFGRVLVLEQPASSPRANSTARCLIRFEGSPGCPASVRTSLVGQAPSGSAAGQLGRAWSSRRSVGRSCQASVVAKESGEHRQRVTWSTLGSIELLEKMIPLQQQLVDAAREAGNEEEALAGETTLARAVHGLWWRRRYLTHLETGGDLLRPSDECAMHHEHGLIIEYPLDGDLNQIGLLCQTCQEWVQIYALGREPEEGKADHAAIYEEHQGHTIAIRLDDGSRVRLICVTCGADQESGWALLSGDVSDWFEELWNG